MKARAIPESEKRPKSLGENNLGKMSRRPANPVPATLYSSLARFLRGCWHYENHTRCFIGRAAGLSEDARGRRRSRAGFDAREPRTGLGAVCTHSAGHAHDVTRSARYDSAPW